MRTLVENLNKNIGKEVTVSGWVWQFRQLSKMSFLILRERTGNCQIIIPKELEVSLSSESVVEVTGMVKEEKQSKYNQIEIVATSIKIVSEAETLPYPINRIEEVPFNTVYGHRPLTLRSERERNIFKIKSHIINYFRLFLIEQGFTEIFSPKISSSGLEGGSSLFEVNYYETPLYLTQSPQFYKQMMVGVYERVFEVGKVYRAEGSNTNRHLSEYVGLDLEMGFIESVEEVMNMEESCFKYIFEKLIVTCKKELEYFGIQNLEWVNIPRLEYSECESILNSLGIELEGGLSNESERVLGEYIKKTYNSEFVFVTKYPLSERPFYAMPSEKENESETFELLYKGMEVTSGGQRIHNYEQLVNSIESKGLNSENFESYLIPFKYGMPAHGGLGIGVERIVKQMLGLNTVEEASLVSRTKERFKH
jgi:nondiscriminating aspartyl-tRNA synthetase